MSNTINFANFIKDDSIYFSCFEQTFKKVFVEDKVFIFLAHSNELIYLYIPKESSLFVFNAMYCSYLSDEFWGISNHLKAQEFILDQKTLIKTSNIFN